MVFHNLQPSNVWEQINEANMQKISGKSITVQYLGIVSLFQIRDCLKLRIQYPFQLMARNVSEAAHRWEIGINILWQ